MPQERPFGVLIIASVLTVWGGVASFILIVEIIDSIRFYGLASLMITNPASFAGFILYAALPIMVYSTGIAVFEAKRWAYVSTTRWIPVLMLCFLLNVTYNTLRIKTGLYNVAFLEMFFSHFDDFTGVLAGYAVTVMPLLYYLRQASVHAYFSEI
jgi:hypothetical protein